MTDYSDLLYLIGAMVIYSLLVVNTNAMILQNNQLLTTSEMEYGAISIAQDIFAEVEYTNYSKLDSKVDSWESLVEYPELKDIYDVEVEISDVSVEGSSDNKKVKVNVTSPYLIKGEDTYKISLSYLKTDY